MSDLLMIGITVVFFILSLGLIEGFQRLMEGKS
jgi:ABC-type lipoprotein release transport system permease subunit